MSLPGATETIQWGDDRVFKIGGKMFACSGLVKDSLYSFKVDDHRFLELTDMEGINPAPYLARAKWIQIEPKRCKISSDDLKDLVRNSHTLILAKLPKKTQREIKGQN
jgi:predicted DNA-binding protein (MmcQ/YjbR family)